MWNNSSRISNIEQISSILAEAHTYTLYKSGSPKISANVKNKKSCIDCLFRILEFVFAIHAFGSLEHLVQHWCFYILSDTKIVNDYGLEVLWFYVSCHKNETAAWTNCSFSRYGAISIFHILQPCITYFCL